MAKAPSDGRYPPNPTQWGNERQALELRKELGVALTEPLDVARAFELHPNALLFPHGKLGAEQEVVRYWRTEGKKTWSAMAVVHEGVHIVVFNDSHAPSRVRASLMEEFFHIRLGHSPSKIRLYDSNGRLRTHDGRVEKEAYGCGAAALVPFQPLKAWILEGVPVREIAERFEVSPALVVFRAKVTRQYGRMK